MRALAHCLGASRLVVTGTGVAKHQELAMFSQSVTSPVHGDLRYFFDIMVHRFHCHFNQWHFILAIFNIFLLYQRPSVDLKDLQKAKTVLASSLV